MRGAGGQTVRRSGSRADRPTIRPSEGRTVGATLIELLVVLIVLGVIGALGTLGLASLRAPPGTARLDSLRLARTRALRTGEPVTIRLDSVTIRFLADGRVLGGELDPLTGEPRNAH